MQPDPSIFTIPRPAPRRPVDTNALLERICAVDVLDRLRVGGLVSRHGIVRAQRLAFDTTRRVFDVLVDEGLVNEGMVATFLSFELGLPRVRLELVRCERRLVKSLPRWIAEALCVLPVYIRELSNGTRLLYLAMDDPTAIDALKACSVWTGLGTRPLVATTSEIRRGIAAWYSNEGVESPSRPLRRQDGREELPVNSTARRVVA